MLDAKDKKRLMKNPITWILLVSPLFMWALMQVLPTFDDWTYFTTPFYDFGDKFVNRLVPRYSYWRPWDGIFGYVLSLWPSMFPTLNHIAVYTGHVGCCVAVFLISGQLGFKPLACWVATLTAFLSPAILGTVLGIDALNQTYSAFWGLLGMWFYLRSRDRANVGLWLLCTVIATFAKENGMAYFVIPQIVAWGFGKVTMRQALSHTGLALLIIIAYFAARTALTSSVVDINGAYFENTLSRKVRNLAIMVLETWVPFDYVCLFYKPTRNLAVVAVTLAIGMPFVAYVYTRQRRALLRKPALCLLLAIAAAASPHLLTLYTTMHTYASLGMASLLAGHLASQFDTRRSARTLTVLFALYVADCLFIDWHHWQKALESGLAGKKMADDVYRQTTTPPRSVYVIHLDRGEKKYSMFCVIPYDAFGWGAAVAFRNHCKWPEDICDTNVVWKPSFNYEDYIPRNGKYDAVWYVHGDTVDVVRGRNLRNIQKTGQ